MRLDESFKSYYFCGMSSTKCRAICEAGAALLREMGDAWPSFTDRHAADLMDAVSSAAELHRLTVAPRATLTALDAWLAGSGFNLADPMIEALESAVEIAGDLDLDWPFDPKEAWAIVAPYVALTCVRCLEDDDDNAPNAHDALEIFLKDREFSRFSDTARAFQRALIA